MTSKVLKRFPNFGNDNSFELNISSKAGFELDEAFFNFEVKSVAISQRLLINSHPTRKSINKTKQNETCD